MSGGAASLEREQTWYASKAGVFLFGGPFEMNLWDSVGVPSASKARQSRRIQAAPFRRRRGWSAVVAATSSLVTSIIFRPSVFAPIWLATAVIRAVEATKSGPM